MAERKGRKAGQSWYLAMFQGIDLALQILTGEPVRFLNFVTTEVWPGTHKGQPGQVRRFRIESTFVSSNLHDGEPQRLTSSGLPLLRDNATDHWRIRGFDDALRLHCSRSVYVSCLGNTSEWLLDAYFTYGNGATPFVEIRQCDLRREQIVGRWITGHDLRDRKIQEFHYGPTQPRRVSISL